MCIWTFWIYICVVPRMKISVFLAEISCFGRWWNVDGRNIHKFRQKLEKFRRNFDKKRNFGYFLKKIGSNWKISEKNHFVSFYFGDFSPILWKKICTSNTRIWMNALMAGPSTVWSSYTATTRTVVLRLGGELGQVKSGWFCGRERVEAMSLTSSDDDVGADFGEVETEVAAEGRGSANDHDHLAF